MTNTDNETATLHRRMFTAVEAHDYGMLREIYSSDYEYRGPDGEVGDVAAGVGVAKMYGAAFPDLSFEITHQWCPDATVSVVEFIARGRHTGPLGDLPATGKSATVHGSNVVETSDGKIIREREYVDTMTLMRQLGVVE